MDEAETFDSLCAVLEQVSVASGKEVKRGLVTQYLQRWRDARASALPALRLLLPDKVVARGAESKIQGLQAATLAKRYSAALGLPAQSPDAAALARFAAPGLADSSATGDFPAVLAGVIEKYSTVVVSTVSIGDINVQLDALCAGGRKADECVEVLLDQGARSPKIDFLLKCPLTYFLHSFALYLP